MLNREEAKKFLLEELKKVPNREVCRQCATVEQLNRIFKEIEFDEMADFLIGDNLELKISEIPEDQKFEAILYFSNLNRIKGVGDWEIWDLIDVQTGEWYDRTIKEMFELEYDDLCDLKKEAFIEYAKSDKPDF